MQPVPIETVIEVGLRNAEQAVRDSRNLDYAYQRASRFGHEKFQEAIELIAKRDPFDGYRYDDGTNPEQDRQPGAADVGGEATKVGG